MQEILDIYNKVNQFGIENNMELTIIDDGHIEYKMPILEKHLATPIAAHGGIISALMDSVLGVSALTISAKDENLVSTVEFKINYLNPANKGDILKGVGKVIHKGKRIIISQGDIYSEQTGKHIATGTGTFNAYPYHKAGFPDLITEG